MNDRCVIIFSNQKFTIMKRVLPIIGIALVSVFVFTSCKSKSSSTTKEAISQVDTTGLAQFEAWKKQQEFAEQYAIYAANNKNPNAATKAVRTVYRQTNGSRSTTTSYPAKAPEKKRWSKAAKGATIGAASGAVLGAVIAKKNRGLGAVIGGVAGGGIGYGIGRHLDKKDGR